MFDFIRNLTKSAEERRRETLNAYVDGELSAAEQRQFEAKLEEDAALQAEVAQLRRVKQGIRQLPRVRAPRNFTLDPAVYGRPQPQPAYELYPALRVATALAAFFFVIAVVLDLVTPAGGLGQPLAAVSQQEPVAADVRVTEEAAEVERFEATQAEEEVVVEGEEVEVTRIVTESVEEEEMAAAAEEEAPEALEEAAEEGAPEEGAPEEAEMEAEIAEEPAEEPTEGPLEEPAAEAEASTATAEDEATAQDVEDGEGPAAAAPAAAITATETAEATSQPAPTTVLEAPEEAPEAETLPVEEPVEEGLPLLLIAEIVFGVGLVVLLTVTLFMRRNL